MKIEKISDNQVKIILSHQDLEARDIRIAELAYGSEKTQSLFREMMEQASIECGFDADNVPLMIEAIPFAVDGITIIVTKVASVSDIEERFSLLEQLKQVDTSKTKSRRKNEKRKQEKTSNISIFSFDSLDTVTSASVRLYGIFNGTNILFKNQNRYFLFLQNDSPQDSISSDDIDAVLSEYGQKHISTAISKHYLTEHGEIIIKNPAIKIMAQYLNK